jgi:hypothetical protein
MPHLYTEQMLSINIARQDKVETFFAVCRLNRIFVWYLDYRNIK